MSPRLTSLVLGFAFACLPALLVIADVVKRSTLVEAAIPLVVLAGLPGVAGALASRWVLHGRSRAESAGRGFLAGFLPMMAISLTCFLVVKMNGPVTAAWMLVLSISLTLLQAAIGTVLGALLHAPTDR